MAEGTRQPPDPARCAD